MLGLLALFIGIVIALCILLPMIGIPLLIIGVALYGFGKGFLGSLWETYQNPQKTNIKAKPTPIKHFNQHTDKYVGDET